MYEFSVPMPFNKKLIDKLLDINNNIEKSRITSFYFSLPSNSTDATGFEQSRFCLNFNTDFEYWKPLIEYTINNGFDFIYLLNSPKIYNSELDNLQERLEILDRLINNLRNLGCNKVRICNPQLIEHINKNYSDIELYLSTSAELQSVKQYSTFFEMFSNIKEFVPSLNLNKNFRFLKNIKKKFPDIKIELMVNEGCIPSCPIRTSHNIFITGLLNDNVNSIFSSQFYLAKCIKLVEKDIPLYLCNINIIYPWEIKEYSKIGINNFKLAGRNNENFKTGEYLDYYKYYLKGVDDIKNIINHPIRYFNNYIIMNKNINYTVNELKPYLPDIKYFIKNGDLCSSRCGINCKYCYKLSSKIQKIFNKQEREIKKRTVPFCVVKNKR